MEYYKGYSTLDAVTLPEACRTLFESVGTSVIVVVTGQGESLLSFSFPSAWPPPLNLRLFLRHRALSFEVVASPARPIIFLVSLFLCHYVALTCLLCSLHSHSLSRFRHAQHGSAPSVEGPARRTGDSTPCMRSTSSSASSSASVTSRMASNSAFFFSSSAFFLASSSAFFLASSRAFRSASAFA